MLAVFWATVAAFVTSFLHRDCALFSYDLFRGREPLVKGIFGSKFFKALEAGSTGVLNVATTCAGAGIIVGVVTLPTVISIFRMPKGHNYFAQPGTGFRKFHPA